MLKKEKKTLVLLDAHAIIHRAYHALPNFSSSKGEPTGALYGLVTMVLKTVNEIKPDYIVACFDVPEPTYRHKVYDEYKAGRAKADEALIIQLKKAKDVFKAFNIPIYEAPGFEADDVIGTIVEKVKNKKDISVIIASGDMDTLQLVDGKKVQALTLRKGIKDTVLYDEKAVFDRFGFPPELLSDFKGLRGDPSDNIPGIKGVGDKTATNLIISFGKIENIITLAEKNQDKLKEAGFKDRVINLLKDGAEEARFSKMLATIRTDAPINFSIPDKKWKDDFDHKKVESLLLSLDFRSLVGRVWNVNGLPPKKVEEKRGKENLNKRKIKELKVATWLINSDLTQPEENDILNLFNCKNLSEAYPNAMNRLKKDGMEELFLKIEKPLISIIEKMSKRGIKIDTKELKKIEKEYKKELKEQEKKIWKHAGREFNINSPRQLGEVLFDEMGLSVKNHKKTSTGVKSTRESELLKLEGQHPIVDEILTHREIAKLISTYIEPILLMVDKEGKLHAEFVQTGTTTGRISSNKPNLQNIPISSSRGKRIRDVFIASPGNKLIAFDYSQIELRVAALLSKDKKMVSVFKKGGDIHTTVATEVFSVSKDEVDKEMRRKAKVINFGIMYGMGVNALKQNLETSQSEARHFLERYFEKFSGLASYIEEVKETSHNLGYTKTFFGRRRYVAGLNSPVPYIRAGAERAAVNAPIQGTAADIIKRASVLIHSFLEQENQKEKAVLLLQVHDELVFEVVDGFCDDFISSASKIMQSFLKEEKKIDIPFEVHIEVGKSWGKMNRI